ncbi:MAG: acyl-ACP--UDP-N-acetylglucosamine O-acyltransferase [Proteobacteria bacterium]|nr:acyl-ACP--UDP-N-acetylglucosamine O-acyltransferase [Cystobacterineae bacterium]MCL2259523.1 acyl-ACP--UDP-N-acetylglucosamine O-acyltransferase [Cystobacterineae bacterium]MCL2314002.1 acyl-ACP--UDP-N-acetylglucosamine O-acyltransferase [Pseudomonadota bacterium]
MSIHPTAIVHEEAEIHPQAEVGPYCVLGPRVRIGAKTRIGPHVVIAQNTTLGEENRVFQFASLGEVPQDLKYAGEQTQLVIGDRNTIRECATLHIGTEGGGGKTQLGDDNLVMAYSHVAHDCKIGNHCILANAVNLAGHVEVGDCVIMGGLSAVHQFTRIGKHAFISGGSMVTMDVLPYCIAQGDRAELAGLNKVGLTRHGFGQEQQERIKEAYRILFRSQLSLSEALGRLKETYAGQAEIEELIRFIEGSKRGMTR